MALTPEQRENHRRLEELLDKKSRSGEPVTREELAEALGGGAQGQDIVDGFEDLLSEEEPD